MCIAEERAKPGKNQLKSSKDHPKSGALIESLYNFFLWLYDNCGFFMQHPQTPDGVSVAALQASFFECFETFGTAVETQASLAVKQKQDPLQTSNKDCLLVHPLPYNRVYCSVTP